MRRTCTILLGAAGACWAAGQAVLPDMGLETAERYDAVSAQRGLEAASAGLLVLAAVFLVAGALVVATRAPRTRLVRVGTLLTALGALWLVGGRAAFNLMFYRLTGPDVPREAALTVLDSPSGTGFVPLVLMLPALLLGPLLLAVGLRRAGLAGWAPLVLWVAGIGIFLAAEFTLKAGEVVGVGLAGTALALTGRAVDGHQAVGQEPAVTAGGRRAAAPSPSRTPRR